jgi:tetraacyldisaccharide 4'-kinase
MFRKILFPVSLLYGLGAIFRRFIYETGLRKKKTLPKKVISVGNLSVGGSGKTPITIEIANYLKSKSIKPVVLSRGYKRKSKEDYVVCSEVKDWEKCGDEPYLMTLKGIEVVVGKNRYKNGLLYLDKADVFILDDGYQHFQLERDLNILVIDATKPFWKDSLIPVGNLREPKSFYRFADCFIITRTEFLQKQEDFFKKLKTYKKPFFVAESQFEGVLDNSWKLHSIDFLKGKKVVVFAGLGNNQQFFKTVENLSTAYGFLIEKKISFPDHYHYEDFTPDKRKLYLTTEKDLVKLKNYDNIYALSYRLNLPKEFYEFMEGKLWRTKTL